MYSGDAPPRLGWRLARLEMQNWGTFHRKVHRLMPEGCWSLVVGENGSGKSTAIDALRTLIVPPRLLRLSYNDASTGGRGDRTRYSYVRGAWRSQGSDAAAQGTPDYLRGEGQHSTLLAVFTNESKKVAVTLAQILWLSGDKVDELFLIKLVDASIAGDLSGIAAGTAIEWKRELKERRWEVRDEFSSYAARFTGLLGLKGDGALEVFNQAIGVKDVSDINDFVRRHMLAPANAIEFVRETLLPLYKELSDCYNAIQRARRQIEALDPIAVAHDRKAAAQIRLDELKNYQQAAPLYYAHEHLSLLRGKVEELTAESARGNSDKAKLSVTASTLQATIDSLNSSISNHEIGREIKRLEEKETQAEKRRNQVERRFNPWSDNLQRLGMSTPESEDAFLALRGSLDELLAEATAQESVLQESLADARLNAQRAKTEEKKIRDDLDMASKRRVSIDADLLRIRDSLCDDTGILPSDIPFAGELMEVKHEHREWTGAIERVLHGFAVSLLVPSRHFDIAARWINGRHLGFRFVFYRIHEPDLDREIGGLHLRPGRIAARLDYKTDHPLHKWSMREVSRRFLHECCEDVAHLSRVDAGVTREGLIRETGARHIKDDRHRVDDPRFWVLGWSAERKIKALLAALEENKDRLREAEATLDEASIGLKSARDRLHALAALLTVEQFDEIDLTGARDSLLKIKSDLMELRQANDDIQKLEQQRDVARQELQTIATEIEVLIHRNGQLDEAIRTNSNLIRAKESILKPHHDFRRDDFGGKLRELETVATLTLDNIDNVATEVVRRLQGQANHQTSICNAADRDMGGPMASFLRDFPEYKGSLIDRPEYSGEFAAERLRLKEDELPRHEVRFRTLMDENLIGNIAQFSTLLRNREEEARGRIEQVNKALALIPYTPGTHVQIKTSTSPHREVVEFRARLRSCLDGGLNPTDELRDTIIERIRLMMEDFRTKEDWAKRVTDVREWLEFGVRELNTTTGAEINYLTGSSGRSGGQKAKLAFTILASAITAQYGLAESPDDASAFRLVLIDEVFSHTDEAYSRQALDLFKSLGLQLIVVNPFDAKARIVEPYVDSFHLTANPNRNDSRITRATRAEYEAARGPTDHDVPI